MSRYYCQLVRVSSNVSPSIKMLCDYASNDLGDCQLEILDAGCGNGRNSIALAKRFHANVLLVDYDSEMMEHARQRFHLAGLPLPGTIEKPIEEILDGEDFQSRRFDFVILSYVLQHVNPACFTKLFDTLKLITRKFLAIDTYWNPSYCQIGEKKEVGSTSWYGISREALLRLVAPRFRILGRRTFVSKPRSVVTFSVLRFIPGVFVRARFWFNAGLKKCLLFKCFSLTSQIQHQQFSME
jgi:SAM-dependent methyltransferase